MVAGMLFSFPLVPRIHKRPNGFWSVSAIPIGETFPHCVWIRLYLIFRYPSNICRFRIETHETGRQPSLSKARSPSSVTGRQLWCIYQRFHGCSVMVVTPPSTGGEHNPWVGSFSLIQNPSTALGDTHIRSRCDEASSPLRRKLASLSATLTGPCIDPNTKFLTCNATTMSFITKLPPNPCSTKTHQSRHRTTPNMSSDHPVWRRTIGTELRMTWGLSATNNSLADLLRGTSASKAATSLLPCCPSF